MMMMMTYCMRWHRRRRKKRWTNCILDVLFLPTKRWTIRYSLTIIAVYLTSWKLKRTNAVTWELRTCCRTDSSLSNDSMYTSTTSVGSRPDFFRSFWTLLTIYIYITHRERTAHKHNIVKLITTEKGTAILYNNNILIRKCIFFLQFHLLIRHITELLFYLTSNTCFIQRIIWS